MLNVPSYHLVSKYATMKELLEAVFSMGSAWRLTESILHSFDIALQSLTEKTTDPTSRQRGVPHNKENKTAAV
jgi:hypothetical protein